MVVNDDVNESELENKFYKQKLSDYERKIEELERQYGIQQNELQLFKKMANNGLNKNKEENNQQILTQLDQMEKKQKSFEETYKNRIEELVQQNASLKKENEKAKSQFSSNQLNVENDLAKLSIENESLKRQVKEMTTKLMNSKNENKDLDEIKRKISQIESEKEKVESELLKTKVFWNY